MLRFHCKLVRNHAIVILPMVVDRYGRNGITSATTKPFAV